MEDNFATHPANNRHFNDVVHARLSRRKVLAGGAAAAATTFFVGSPASALTGAPAVPAATAGWGNRPGADKITFAPVPNEAARGPEVVVSEDYEYQALIPWGTPIQPDGPQFSWPQTSAADAEQQVGIGHDGMWYYPVSRTAGFMCINHEFGRNTHVLGKEAPETLEEVRIMQASHGVTVIKIAQDANGTWAPVADRRNRRITPNTPVRFTGPMVGSSLLSNNAGNVTAGTVNNCGNGYTPWGTYLTCEENFNGYFGSSLGDDFEPTEEQARYGFSANGFGYDWFKFDPRFDLSNPDYANEHHRFGWIVEIDPFKKRRPRKRTALGRFKHEGCALTIGRGGRAVAYMGDDERFDYIYKFVGNANYEDALAKGLSPLDNGKLYAARFNDDGTGDWLELTIDNPDIADRFSSQDEVLCFARIAADILGATPMDRPEWTTVSPSGDVFCTLTNNSRREEANAANPLAPNPDGHIIRWKDDNNHIGTTFEWDIVRFAQDSFGTPYQFGSPDGLWADADGRVFIETDGGQPGDQNNQLLVSNASGEIRRLLSGVAGDEITGIAITQDRRTLFVNTQHPGNGDPSLTNFPAPTDGVTVPRDSTIVLRRKDGGIVGS